MNIKVRVFCFEDEEMWIANDYEELIELFEALNSDDSFYSIPMLSTNMCDNEDAEIFEGDIVHAYDEDGTSLVGEVFYDDNVFYLKNNKGILNNLWSNAEHIEVVGNIYENK